MTKQNTWLVASLLVVVAAFATGYYLYRQNTAQAQITVAQDRSALVTRAGAPVFGAPEAKVTIVEFFDPACEACRAFHAPVKQIINTSFGRVNLVLRYAPLHKDSDKAALMLEAARLQGKYWPAVKAALNSQDSWASHHAPEVSKLWPVLQAAGVDIERARTDMNSEAVRAILQQDVAALTALKVQRTPTFYVNGKPLTDFGYEQLKQLVAQQAALAYGS
jgi:protein-disulfide isomerase